MKFSSQSKILTIIDLKSRASKEAQFEKETLSHRKISKAFNISLQAGLQELIETASSVTTADCAFIQSLNSELEIQSSNYSTEFTEALSIDLKISETDSAKLYVLKNKPSASFDFEDYRLLESLCEIAEVFIHQHLMIRLERDNLERVFNSTPSASAIWRGEDLIIDRVNEAYQALFPDLELEGKPFEEALPPRIVRDYPELFRNVLRTGEAFSIQEQHTPVQHFAGGPLEDHYYNINFVQLKNKDGSAYGVYQHTVDITEQVEARNKIQAALKARDVFMSIASHELNTPLTSLKLQTQLRKKVLLGNPTEGLTIEKNLKFLDHNLSQIHRLSLLVNDMLDIGKINSGQLSMNKSLNSLTDLMQETYENFSLHFEALGVKLIPHIQKDVFLEFDSLRIDQVIINFLTNAIKYAGKNNVELNLKVKDGFAIVSVKDNGQGISAENKARIFERFERATSEMNISGMGLGLYISKQIILAHDGIIDVDSAEGKGAEFFFRIPIKNE